MRQERFDVGGHHFNEILCHHRALAQYLLIPFQRMNDAGGSITKTEPIDAMRKIVGGFIEQGADVNVSLGEM